MREPTDTDAVTERLLTTPGLGPLVEEAEEVWRARAEEAGETGLSRPGWRAFEDAFPTFYQFTNRPPR